MTAAPNPAQPQHIAAVTAHARRVRRGNGPANAFRYSVDFVLIDPDAPGRGLFSRNRFNLFAVNDRNHGSLDGTKGADWARHAFATAGLRANYDLRLLTQPSFLGYIFNPVSFWLALRGDDLIGVIAEVNNTSRDRHSYLCHAPDFAPIDPQMPIVARKLMYVSPFQSVAGDYKFTFDITQEKIAIRILHRNGEDGLVATLGGRRRALTTTSLIYAALRRPFGALRVFALIHWQAVILRLKGAPFARRPTPPTSEISQCSTPHNS